MKQSEAERSSITLSVYFDGQFFADFLSCFFNHN